MSINLDRIGWQDGTLVSKAKVEVNGVIYDVEPEQYSGQTPLSSANLKKMEDNTEKAINEVDTELNNKITNLTTYSTEEVKTGETWIDSKPIYRKVFTGSGAGNIDITSLKIDEIFFDLSKTKFFWSNIGRHVPLPLVATASGDSLITGTYQAGIYTDSSKTKLTIEKGTRVEMSKYVITIEYTKTTD